MAIFILMGMMFDICNLLNPTDAIFMGDVDGIFERDPKIYPESKLLKTVKKQQDFNTIYNYSYILQSFLPNNIKIHINTIMKK